MDLNSTDPDTVVCSECWLKLTSGWSIMPDTASSSFMLYERVYPSTRSGAATARSTGTARATATVVTGGTYDICALNGGSVSLPLVGSSVTVITNTATTYVNNLICGFTVRGGNEATTYIVEPLLVSTEAGFDFFYVRNAFNVIMATYQGTGSGGAVTITSPTLALQFVSDVSNVGTGVQLRITLGVQSSSGSVRETSSPRASFSVSRSSSVSGSISDSVRGTLSLHVSPSSSQSSSVSGRLTDSPGWTLTPQVSPSSSQSSGLSASASVSPSISVTPLMSVSPLPSYSASHSSSLSGSGSVSASQSPSDSSSLSSSLSGLPTSSLMGSRSSLITASISGSGSQSDRATVSNVATLSRSSHSTRSLESMTAANSRSVSYSPSSHTTASASGARSASPSASPIIKRLAGPPPTLPTNLSSLSMGQINGLFGTLALYDPTMIHDSLQKLGMAGLTAGGGAPLSISTDAFVMQIAPIAAGAGALVTEGVKVGLPPLKSVFPDAAGASLINWVTTPYTDSSQALPDSPTISLTLLNSGGGSIAVSNLSTPISLSMDLNLAADDWRLQVPPTYFVRCDIGQILVQTGSVYSVFTGGVVYPDGVVSVPCIQNIWYNHTCSAGAFLNITCPAPIVTQRCLYWNTNLSTWSSDGCVAIGGNYKTLTCHCTHLTDFSARIDAVVADNKAVFANAAAVYSLEGLIRYAAWYGIFGGIALVTVMLGAIVCRIDYFSTVKYIKALISNRYLVDILQLAPNLPIYIYDDLSTMHEMTKSRGHRRQRSALVVRETEPPKLTLCQRILQQHNRISFFFRYDPRLNRIFRLLSLAVIQFHSLFVTALLYGFTYAGGPMAWYDIVLLSIITTGLNLPVLRLLLWSVNSIGALEFRFLYPVLYAEYHRRVEFERVALIYLANKHASAHTAAVADNGDIMAAVADAEHMDADNDDIGDVLLDYLFMYLLCCFSRKRAEEEDLSDLSQRQLLKRMALNIRESYPYIEAFRTNWGWLPCQTWQGTAFIIGCLGWLAWCLNYLLLFASAHNQSTGEQILTSYAISELSTVFLSQPLIITFMVGLYWTVNRFKAYIPDRVRRLLLVNSVGRIPSLFYFSDPWVKQTKTAFTSEFAYNIFVKCPAAVSGTNELAYAPMKAAANTIGDDAAAADTVARHESQEIASLYMRMITVWKEIQESGR